MTSRRFVFQGFSLVLPSGWLDVTADVGTCRTTIPLTLARPDGVGALQVSAALYKAGASPHVTLRDLKEFLVEFASSHALVRQGDVVQHDGFPITVSARFSEPGGLVWIWYISDGMNVALVTYTTSDSDQGRAEAVQCDSIAMSLEFCGDCGG